MFAKELEAKGLFVYIGLNEDLANQLVERSKEAAVVEYCPNDSLKRFANLEAVKNWQAKGRLALPLVKITENKDMELMGFGWMGPQKLSDDEPNIPNATTTFAIRIYNGATGNGNALPFTQTILEINSRLFGGDGVWLEAWGDNPAALKTYQKTGFKVVAEVPSERHGQKCSRVYMALQN